MINESWPNVPGPISCASIRLEAWEPRKPTAMESYVLLKEPIPASQPFSSLGRIVEDPLRSLHAYCPEDCCLNSLLHVVESTDLDVQTSVNFSGDVGFSTVYAGDVCVKISTCTH